MSLDMEEGWKESCATGTTMPNDLHLMVIAAGGMSLRRLYWATSEV